MSSKGFEIEELIDDKGRNFFRSWLKGFRVYFGIKKETVVLLLCGGEKRTQESDIHRAKILWVEHRSIGK